MLEIVEELKTPGDTADVPEQSLTVTLRWAADVDLDLMALYTTKDGREGGVFSKIYPGGSPGSLDTFPYMRLTDGCEDGYLNFYDCEEALRIAALNHMREVHIVAFSYSDALEDQQSCLAEYNAKISVRNGKAESVEVPLNSTEPGQVAIVCKIDNSNPGGPKLVNINNVMSVRGFSAALAGGLSNM
jgi:uncharacterized protein involved in tellurium resistance